MKKILFPIICTSLLVGCASASSTFAPDGREAFSLNCSGTLRNWGMCHKEAGNICGSKGYEILMQNGEQGSMLNGSSNTSSSNLYGSSLHFRTMTIACKKAK